MEIRNYLTALCAGSLICMITLALGNRWGSFQPVLRLLAGAFMISVLLRLTPELPLPDPFFIGGSLTDIRESAVKEGETLAREAMEEGIRQRTRTCILEEAVRLGCDLQVQITLSELIPVGVTLSGPVSPYAKAHLTQWIAGQLDIRPEDQLWMG